MSSILLLHQTYLDTGKVEIKSAWILAKVRIENDLDNDLDMGLLRGSCIGEVRVTTGFGFNIREMYSAPNSHIYIHSHTLMVTCKVYND